MGGGLGGTLTIVIACATTRVSPSEPGAMPTLSVPTIEPQTEAIAAPKPDPIVPTLVAEPAPWLDDRDLLERIVAVQDIVSAAASAHEVEPELINGLIYVESKFRAKAKGGDAQGLMQLIPSTAAAMAKDLGRPRKSYDPDFNIHAGTRLVRRLLDRYDGDVDLALAAYNRGPGVVSGWIRDGEAMPARTRSYVDRVLRARAWFLQAPP